MRLLRLFVLGLHDLFGDAENSKLNLNFKIWIAVKLISRDRFIDLIMAHLNFMFWIYQFMFNTQTKFKTKFQITQIINSIFSKSCYFKSKNIMLCFTRIWFDCIKYSNIRFDDYIFDPPVTNFTMILNYYISPRIGNQNKNS